MFFPLALSQTNPPIKNFMCYGANIENLETTVRFHTLAGQSKRSERTPAYFSYSSKSGKADLERKAKRTQISYVSQILQVIMVRNNSHTGE